jgi:hypothetical protein
MRENREVRATQQLRVWRACASVRNGSLVRAPRPGSCGASTSTPLARHHSSSTATRRAPSPSLVKMFSSLPALVKHRRRMRGAAQRVLLLRQQHGAADASTRARCAHRLSVVVRTGQGPGTSAQTPLRPAAGTWPPPVRVAALRVSASAEDAQTRAALAQPARRTRACSRVSSAGVALALSSAGQATTPPASKKARMRASDHASAAAAGGSGQKGSSSTSEAISARRPHASATAGDIARASAAKRRMHRSKKCNRHRHIRYTHQQSPAMAPKRKQPEAKPAPAAAKGKGKAPAAAAEAESSGSEARLKHLRVERCTRS